MKIKWLRQALQNLDDEAKYIAEDDPKTAKIVVKRMIGNINLLSKNPALGHPGRIHSIRELVIPNTRYILPYRVRPRLNRIEILHISHTSRRLPKSG